MEMTSRYRSVFAPQILSYIDYRYAAGFKHRGFKSALSLFDKFCIENNVDDTKFSVKDGEKWILRRAEEKDRTWYCRVNLVNRFLVYLKENGFEVFPTGNVKISGNTFIPHIYTDDEIESYFKAVDEYVVRGRPIYSVILPVLFRFLLGCGTRIEETLSLRVRDIDLDKGTVRLSETKNSKERLIVMSDSLLSIMRQYADKVFYFKTDADYVFSGLKGKKESSGWIYSIHINILNTAGIPFIGGGDGPRVHDWRHTFAVRSFKQLSDMGYDLYAGLPILSAYLGHEGITSTEEYVRLTLDQYPYLEERFAATLESIFTEEVHHEA